MGALSANERKIEQKAPKCHRAPKPWGIRGIKYPLYPTTLKLLTHAKFGGPKCIGKETRAKSSKMPPGSAPEAPWGVGGHQIPLVPWNSKVTSTFKIWGH